MGVVFGCIVPHPPIIIPEIGRGEERKTRATIEALEKLASRLAEHKPETLFVISPHGTSYFDAMGVAQARRMRGSLAQWGAFSVDHVFENDMKAVDLIFDEAQKSGIPIRFIGKEGYDLDHGVMVPMYYLMKKVKEVYLVPITFCWLSLDVHFEFGKALRRAAERLGRRVAVVASGDLSHRLTPSAPAGYDPMGRVFDQKLVEALRDYKVEEILRMDPDLIERAGECGLRSFVILLGALEGFKVRPEILSYEGPFGVGYLVASFEIESPAGDPEEEVHPAVRLAREAVEKYVRERKRIKPPSDLPPELQGRAGTFVSIYKKGELRGCIGTFQPTCSNIAEEIIQNAISSATQDPRFPPVTEDELPELTYSVDILSPLEPVESLEELDPKRFGIMVESGFRRGLLLPDIEGVDTVERQIEICRLKAGIAPDEPVKIYKFTVRRYREKGAKEK